MNRLVTATLFLTAVLYAESALPCGGGFGTELEMNPAQTIIVRHIAGEETYIFNPHFCGAAVDFGLILPVPTEPSEAPALTETAIFDALEELSAPEIVIEEVCRSRSKYADAGSGDWDNGAAGGGGVNVVNSGQVGIFDWVLLQADASEAFTDWLDANQYPYDQAAVEHFDHYVQQSWFFIAFKVTAGQEAPAEGLLLCGDFGPIRFSFATETPVIPTRIAAVGPGAYHTFFWRLQILADRPMTASDTVDSKKLRYTGRVTAEQLSSHPSLSAIATEGDQFTSLDVTFYGDTTDNDIILAPSDGPTEYRETIIQTEYVDCPKKDGCSVVSPGDSSGLAIVMCALAALLFWRRLWHRS